MAIIISIVLFSLLMVAISFYGYRSYARPGRFYERLGGPCWRPKALWVTLARSRRTCPKSDGSSASFSRLAKRFRSRPTMPASLGAI